MDGDEFLMVISLVILTAIFCFCGGTYVGIDIGMERGAECILSGKHVTEEYECIDIEKLKGIGRTK